MTNRASIWAIDMDRTLLDSDRAHDKLTQIAVQAHLVGRSVLNEAKHRVEATGGSFDTIGYLGGVGVRADELKELCETFAANREGTELLHHDSRFFLDALDTTGQPSIIVTRGSRQWQLPKLQASQLDGRAYLITDTKRKGPMYAGWQDGDTCTATADGGQVLTGNSVAAIDDNDACLEGMSPAHVGYLIQRPGEKQSPVRDVLPPNIAVVPDLRTIMGLNPAVFLG